MDGEHPAGQYLEALFEISEEDITPIRARLADWMGVSQAAVSSAVRRLVADGYLREDGRRLAFTAKGDRLAQKLVRRHRLAEHLLVRVIGLPWHKAHHEAERWERVITDEVESRLVEILGDPATCPHGNPIPGSSRPVDLTSLVPLKDVRPDGEVILRRLTEDLELQLDVMRFLEDSGLVPGARLTVKTIGPDGTMNLSVAGHPVALGPHLSDNLWVESARRSHRRR